MVTNSPATYAVLEKLVNLTEEAILMTAAQEWERLEPLQSERALCAQQLNNLIDDTSPAEAQIVEKLRYIRALEEQLIAQMEEAKHKILEESQQLKKGTAGSKAYQQFKN